MNEKQNRRSPIRRIVAALDASTSSMNALRTAVDLAARFDSELLGLFVEDINLLRLAQLPFAREISFYSPRPRRLEPMGMELQLRIQAARIRNTLALAAEELGVPWEFRIARGDVGAELLAAGAEADLVVLGKIGRSLPGIQRSGSTVRTLLMRRRGMTLVMETRVQFAQTPVVAVYDGSEGARKAAETAAYLARSHDVPLIVFVVAETAETAEKNRLEAEEQLRDLGTNAGFRKIVKAELAELAARIRRETHGAVIIPCLEDWFEGERLCGLVDEIANPVLLIR